MESHGFDLMQVFGELARAKELLYKPEISRDDIETAKKAFAPFMVENYNITDNRIHSAAKTIRRHNRLLMGDYNMEALDEIAHTIDVIKMEVPNLRNYLLFHFISASTPAPRSCNYFDLCENEDAPLIARLCPLEKVFEEVESEHNHKIAKVYSVTQSASTQAKFPRFH